jgi:hypothetical protein
MEAVILAFALGAGTVVAVKNGRKALRRVVGWTAEKTGYITGRVQETLAETRRVARERYEAGREVDGRTELPPPSSRGPESPPAQVHAKNGSGGGANGGATGVATRP